MLSSRLRRRELTGLRNWQKKDARRIERIIIVVCIEWFAEDTGPTVTIALVTPDRQDAEKMGLTYPHRQHFCSLKSTSARVGVVST